MIRVRIMPRTVAEWLQTPGMIHCSEKLLHLPEAPFQTNARATPELIVNAFVVRGGAAGEAVLDLRKEPVPLIRIHVMVREPLLQNVNQATRSDHVRIIHRPKAGAKQLDTQAVRRREPLPAHRVVPASPLNISRCHTDCR